MRKIVPKEIEEKNKKRNQIILGFFLVLVLIVSSISFALQGGLGGGTGQDNTSGNEIEYNGFKFTNQNGVWVLGNFIFKYLPGELDGIGNISSEIKPMSNYQGKPLYIYSKDESVIIDLATDFSGIAQRIQNACPENVSCAPDLPVKTCSDNFIIIEEDIENSVTQQENCVFIKGQKENLAMLADEFLFKALGVK